MKTVIFIIFMCVDATATGSRSITSIEKLITYQNTSGYEIKHKPCQKIAATYSYESDTEDLSKLEYITMNSICDDKRKRYVSFGPSGVKLNSIKEISAHFEKAYDTSLRDMRYKGSSTIFIPTKEYLIKNDMKQMSISKVSKNGYYRWYIQKQCGIVIHALEINLIDLTPDESKELEAKINSGEEIIPVEEKIIIDSFKCTK